jgi:hypothetical protein
MVWKLWIADKHLVKGGGNLHLADDGIKIMQGLYYLGKRRTPRLPEHNFAVNPCFPRIFKENASVGGLRSISRRCHCV